jgi:heptosyltransferase-2
MAHSSVREIIEGNPIVDEIISYDGENEQKGFFNTIKFIIRLKKKRFDLAVILNPAKKFNLITFLAGIPRRVGYNRKWGFLLTDKIEDKKYLGEKHEVEYNLDLVRKIDADTQNKSLFIPINSQDEEFVKELLVELGIKDNNSLIAIHPWTSNPQKQWPWERFVELGDRLIEELGIRVVVIGGDDEVEVTSKFCNSMRNLPINLCAKLSLRQLAAFLRYCKLLISNDSGPVHIASAVKTPTVVIFGGSDPGTGPIRWGPWGEGHKIIYKDSLEEITVDEVFKLGRDSVSARR